MLKSRIPETDAGIQGALDVVIFNQFARRIRDQGLLPVKNFIQAGIHTGKVIDYFYFS